MDNKFISPLCDSQLGVYLECESDPTSHKYNNIIEYSFNKNDIDPIRLAEAIDKVLNHYSTNSGVIEEIDGNIFFVKKDGIIPKTQVINITAEEYEKIRKTYTNFNLKIGPLFRACVYVTEQKVYAFFDIHHLIVDGTTTMIWTKALDIAYKGGELPCETQTPYEYAKEENEKLKNGDFDSSFDYFEKYIGGIENDCGIIPDKDCEDKHCAEYTMFFDADENEIANFSSSNGISENVLALSALTYTLAKYTDQKEVQFLSVNAGRRGKNLDNTMGMFVKSFPLYFKLDDNERITDFVKNTKKIYIDTMKAEVPFVELAQRHNIYTDIKYVFQGDMFEDVTIGGAVAQKEFVKNDNAISNLDIMIEKHHGKMMLILEYKNGLYTKENIKAFADMYNTVLKGFLKCEKLRDIELANDSAKEFINKVNSTEFDYDRTLSVGKQFENAVKKYPNNTAVVYNENKYTYSQLNDEVNKVAQYITSLGIGKEDVVSVLIPRNEYMAIASLGVIKSGAAYQPLDPTYPKDRINFMMSDAKAKLLIADRALVNIADEYTGDVLFVDEISHLKNADNYISNDNLNNAFVLLYTSGTTGVPKGCVLENKNISAFIQSHIKNIGLDSNSRLASYASYGFDATVMDLYPTLTSGAAFYIIPTEIRLDLVALDKFYIDNNITHGFMTTQVARMFLLQTQCKTLKSFVFGGERLTPFNPPNGIKSINGYGPSETLAYVCSNQIVNDSKLQPIGKPNLNTKLYVRDSAGRLLPAGAVGELCVAGEQVSRGYLNRPDKTSEVFIDNPFCNEKNYERMYLTGDIVRMLPDGRIDYIGRRDGQIKVRGFRIELTEVEKIILAFDGIKNVTAQGYDLPTGGKYVCAYIVADKEIDVDKLNEFILANKPPYMVPEITMQIDSIPLNANGKVDKRKLPQPTKKFDEIIPPQNDIQKKIFKIVCDVIGNNELGITTDLFNAGLNSIGSIKLNAMLSKEFGVAIQIKDLKKNSTIKKLEKFFANSNNDEIEKLDSYNLTMTEEGVFVECLNNPKSTVYNIPLLLKINSSLDDEKLKSSIIKAIEAHPYIKTELFDDGNGIIFKKRMDDAPFSANEIEIINTDNLNNIKNNLIKPFALLNNRLFRFAIINAEEKYLLLDIHHIIADGTSLAILFDDIEKAYNGTNLKSEEFTGFDKAYSEKIARESKDLEDAKEYYDTLLNGYDTDFIPNPDIQNESEKGSGRYIAYQKLSSVKSVKNYCNNNNISINGMLCGVFGFVLAKYNANPYAMFNTIYNGRNDSRLERTVSMLVKTLPILTKIDEKNIKSYLKNISNQLVDSMSNDIYSYAEISREYGVNNDIIFIYQGDSFSFSEFCGKPSSIVPLELSDKKAPMVLQVSIVNDKFKFDFEYDNNLYTEKLIKTLVSVFDKTINEFINSTNLDDVDITPEEVIEEMDIYNDTDYSYDEFISIGAQFENAVKEYPNNIALEYNGKEYTYLELNNEINKVSSYVSSLGVGYEDVVSILIERNEFMPITALGVIKTGAAYQPLDPTYPKERINFMMSDAKAKLLIADRNLVNMASEYSGKVLYTDEIFGLPSSNYKAQDKPENAFVLLYTSGTTGVPKGCVLENRNVSSFVQSNRHNLNITSNSKFAGYASFGFDATVADLYTTLTSGAGFYVIPTDIRMDLAKMEEYYVKNSITHGFMTTQVARMFLLQTKCESLKAFVFGGERLTPFNPPKNIKALNGYGPSETLAYVCSNPIIDDKKLQPIGKPNLNTKCYIIDTNGKRLPYGACGELCIAGNQVARGYLGRPDKTAEVFVENQFTNNPKYKRMYKTGDIARQLTDGNFDFVGRRDGQVKIRGFRVELTEVEQIIKDYPGIKNATVQAFDSPAGGKYLAAYIVCNDDVDINTLNDFIRKEKPPYMVPSVTMKIDDIPLNANGKVDKRKLPKPENVSTHQGEEPKNETEKSFCAIFEEVLGIDKVYADDDFFSIGGSSISAVQVVVKAGNIGHSIVYKNLFENPTPQLLAQFVKKGDDTDIIYAPTGKEREKYDYSCIEYNIPSNLDNIQNNGIGDVLVTGVTGFLGSHLLKELLQSTDSKIVCVVRSKPELSASERLEITMMYYFEDIDYGEYKNRITVIDGELENDDVLTELEKLEFDTIINCAANVKHFGKSEALLKDNFSGVEHLIKLAEKKNCKLVQISSCSVCGESVNGHIPLDFVFKENNLNIGQSLENKYVYSKYLAEQAIIDATSRGKIRGKVVRLGNLMARDSDSEFQINASNNGFLNQFAGYCKLGCFPIDLMDSPIELSPIDSVAKAVILLSGTPDKFTIFHAKNCNSIQFGYVVNAMKKSGMKIDIVSMDEFDKRLKVALENSDDVSALSSFITYQNKANENMADILTYSGDNREKKYDIKIKLGSDMSYTTKALYRLGFAWPLISSDYLEKMIEILSQTAFFD